MNYAISKIKIRLSFTEVLYLILFISVICAFRAVTSMCIGLMILVGFVEQKFKTRLFTTYPENIFIGGCILFFLLQVLSLTYTSDFYEGLSNAQKKTGLVFTPLALYFLGNISYEIFRKLFCWYSVLVLVASLFLLCIACIKYLSGHDSFVFFYHALVAPFSYHAVYFSILVFIALSFLLESLINRDYLFNKWFDITALIFLSFFLFLLASKLVLSFYIIYLVYLLIVWSSKNQLSRLFTYTTGILLIFSTSFILATQNPVSNRFRDFTHGNFNLFNQDSFSPTTYFNGLQFRLLQWKLIPEILSENNCWWRGVSIGDAQSAINKKYLALNMFHGQPGREGHGYIDYNAHNQLLQSLLESGIPGAAIFIVICVSLVLIAVKIKRRLLSFTIILLLIYLFVESLFEEQYGIAIFTLWPLFIYNYYKAKPAARETAKM